MWNKWIPSAGRQTRRQSSHSSLLPGPWAGLHCPGLSTDSDFCLCCWSQVHEKPWEKQLGVSHPLFHIPPSLKVLQVPWGILTSREDEARASSGTWLKDDFLKLSLCLFCSTLPQSWTCIADCTGKKHKQNPKFLGNANFKLHYNQWKKKLVCF